MTPIELKEAIRLHSLWLSEEGGGVRANLEGANLEGANLEGAYLAWANLEGANLKGAYLEGANLAWAYLAWANLEGANLEGAYLAWANLEGANLEGANLEGANLEGAYLAWANLEGANLAWANLAWANLEGAMRGKGRTFATTPIRITGGQYPALIADGWVEIGCSSWAFEEFATLHAHTGTTNFSEGKALILAAIAYKEALKS